MATDTGNLVLGKMASKSQGVGKNQGAEFFQSHGSSSSSRPSSNYGTRSQQAMGSQKGKIPCFLIQMYVTTECLMEKKLL